MHELVRRWTVNSVTLWVVGSNPAAPTKKNKKVGIVKEVKKHIKKERYENGFTEKQIKNILKQRKVERPPLEILKNEIFELGFEGTGRKYNVTGNSIKKWLKTYEKLKI